MNSKMKILIMTLCISLFVVGCGLEPVENDHKEAVEIEKLEPEYGGEINLPLTNIKTLNPLVNKNELYYYFQKLVYESLFEIDNSFNITPKLAESYSIGDEGKVVNIKLRDDVYWHDGEKLKAEDVIFTLECIKSLGTSSMYGSLINQGLNTLDNFNLNKDIVATGSGSDLTITYTHPYGNNLEVLTFPIIPSHLFNGAKEGIKEKDFPLVGTGPFVYDSYAEFKELKLVGNETYRDGKPYLDRVVGNILDSREDTLRAFETGQINSIVDMGINWEKYGKNSRMKLMEYTSSSYEFLGFNFKNPIFEGKKGKQLRQAIAYSLDRETIIDKAYLGHGKLTDAPLQPNSWINIDMKYDYDLEKANKEMNLAGYKNKDEEGYFIDGNGKRLSFRLLTNSSNSFRFNAADMVRKNLKTLGIEVVVVPESQSGNTLTQEEINAQWNEVQNLTKQGNFDMVLSGWDFSYIPELNFIFHSGKAQGDNFISYANENTDKLLEEVAYSGGSRDKKQDSYKKLDRNLIDNLPYVSICFKNKALIMDKKFYGENQPTFYNPYRNFDKVFIKSNGKNK